MATIAKIFNNKSGFLLALLLMFFIGTAAVVARTLTDDKKPKATAEKKLAVQWTFTGSSTSDILDYTKYSLTATPPAGCGAGSALPCRVNFPDGTDDPEALEEYLTTSGRTNADVLAISPNKRN